MDSKKLIIAIIGILIGGVFSYYGAYIQYSPKINDLRDETQTLGHSIDQITKHYNALFENHSQLASDFNTREENYDTLSETYEEVVSDFKSLSNEHNTLSETHEEVVSDFKSLSNEHNTLSETHEEVVSDFKSLSNEHNTLSETHEEVVSDFKSLSNEHETLTTDFNSLNNKYDTLSDNYVKIVWNFESLSDEHDTLTTDFNSLDHTYDTLSSNYEALLNQYQKAVASLPLSPEPISAETINMNYEWTFKGREWNLSLLVPESQYDYYQEKERTSTRDYSVYVTHPFDDEFINTIIMKFNFIALEMEYTEEEKINLVISFVQSLPYTSDNVTTPYDEYPRYPLETLVDNGGDCEDTSILTCALLKSMNYDVILIAPPRHMAVGVNIDTDGWSYTKNNKQYFYLETTSEGWEIGSIPDEYKQVGAYRYELKPTPIITHNWTASWKGSTLEVVISVQNEGTAIASGIWVKTGFDAGESKWWKREESDPFDLNWGKSYTITLLLDPPPENKHTRLIILVKDIGGNTLNRRYSNWFDT